MSRKPRETAVRQPDALKRRPPVREYRVGEAFLCPTCSGCSLPLDFASSEIVGEYRWDDPTSGGAIGMRHLMETCECGAMLFICFTARVAPAVSTFTVRGLV